ncbi:Proline-specific permease [Sphaceloma murrayae]|uniref:Protein YOP1 n=1 Tax=Sphaceloma murrayae TaxID=2082308 RepID=A0A2K1QFG4_9PEZI|nr:Proline-specific permease [Sphaceloma murrayae]
MFGIIADSLTTVTSVLFPVFASYKAIRTSDPAQLTPWLMYWTTLSLFLAGESFFHPILSWTPFYSWIRLGVHLYLVLPGQQGSVFLYRQYLHPWLEVHEREIDDAITKGHEKAKAAGLGYVNQAIELVRTKVFGLPPKQPTPPPSQTASYSQNLLSRFAMPSARPGFPSTAGANDLFSMLGNVVQQATAGGTQSRDVAASGLTASGHLIPPEITGEERRTYISTQRNRIMTLLQAFDSAAYEAEQGHAPASPPRGADYLKKSKSEAEFEDLAGEDIPEGSKRPEPGQAGWSKWIWGNYGEKDSALPGKKEQ